MPGLDIVLVTSAVTVLALDSVLAFVLLRHPPRMAPIHWLVVAVTTTTTIITLVRVLGCHRGRSMGSR